ncbi:MAG: hypothetical protein ACTSVI_09545 [Promethearchaeota archaeon]
MNLEEEFRNKIEEVKNTYNKIKESNIEIDLEKIENGLEEIRKIHNHLKQNKKPSYILVSFRLKSSDEKKLLISQANKRGLTLSEFIRGVIFRENAMESQEQHTTIKELSEYISFMFNFFQKNADNLDITESERRMLKKIYSRMKEMSESV